MRLLLCLLPLSLMAVNYEPWFSPSFEIQAEAGWQNRTFDYIDGDGHDLKFPSNDNYALGHLGLSAFDQYDVQVEVVGGQTKQHSFNFDHVSLTLRYLIWDDITGDPFSVVFGVTGSQAVTQAVDDFSWIHHSKAEGEMHLTIGREVPCGASWTSHWWLVGGYGCGGTGSPWWRTNGYYEHNFRQSHILMRLFVEGLIGCGKEPIRTVDHFHGYGPIRHRSLDVGCRATYQTDFNGSLKLQYARRLVAKNCPKQVNIFTLSYLYPIGP